MQRVQVTLPFPPSSNAIWRAHNGRVIKSARYRDWLFAAKWKCVGLGKVPGKYRLSILAQRPDNRRRDIGNLEKPISDLLVQAGVIEDDSLAQSIQLDWMIADPVKGGRIFCTIEGVNA